MQRNLTRAMTRVGAKVGACVLAMGLAASAGMAQTQILEVYGPSLTTYQPTGATAVQSIRPLSYGEQRGVTIDGSVRAGSAFGWALNGNSVGGGGGAGGARLGDLRLDTLGYAPTKVDIALPAPGFSFVVGRTFNGQQEGIVDNVIVHRDSNGYQGKNWQQLAQPEIVLFAGATSDLDVLYIMYGADRYIEFQRTGSGTNFFKGKNGAAGIVEFAGNGDDPDTYTYTDQRGTQVVFLGFDAGAASGQFWKQTDVAGNTMYVGSTTLSSAVSAGYTSGRILKAYDSADRRYSFTYTTLDGTDRLTQVIAEIRTGGNWTSPTGVSEVARVDYAYYGTAVEEDYRFGDHGTLRLVTVTTPMTDSGVSLVKKTHYRYGTTSTCGTGSGVCGR